MKSFVFQSGTTKEAAKSFADEYGLSHVFKAPREDFYSYSSKVAAFVVSDGVTLNFRIYGNSNIDYPNPSPSGEVAKIFCQSIIENIEKNFNVLSISELKSSFRRSNREVALYNSRFGKTRFSGNITGLYAATASFIAIKDKRVFWGVISDSYVAHFDANMRLINIYTGTKKRYYVVNGQRKMIRGLSSGVFLAEKGHRVLIYTDGFENYINNERFMDLFKEWPGDLHRKLRDLTSSLNKKNPSEFGHEKTLVAVLI
jgi:hypothetical protein